METTEYQIFIGCYDVQAGDEIVRENELTELITAFFNLKQIAFSIFSTKGGFLYENGDYICENTLCVNFIGDQGLDIVRFTKSLSMFMNQKRSLILKNTVDVEYC